MENVIVAETSTSFLALSETNETLSPSLPHSLTPPLPQSSASSRIGLALFGVGRWGSHLLRNFLRHPQARVVAVADISLERINGLSQRFDFDFDSDDVILTTGWQEALRSPNIEAVVIATPAATHYTLIQEALRRGLHILAEKPLTLDVAESFELCHLAAQQQRQLVIDHTYLFHPAIRRGKEVIQQGTLGALRYGYAARTHLGPIRQDVDALWDLAIHDIAIFNHWLSESPVQVQAQGAAWLQSESENPYPFDRGLSDLVWVKLVYPSGFQAFIHLCWSNPDKQRRLSIAGSQGTLIFDEMASAPLTLLQGRLEQTDRYFSPAEQHQQILNFEAIEPLQQVCSHFLTCVQQNTSSWISPGRLGAELVQILTALTLSLRQGGRTVDVA
ncbi:MAG: Gfo/Idh/MocA family oxidoreductase [Cyanobacteria bacterium CRU_2_1]|nr:Gfo/Idh/MocA family oxidoreductase [Cyanobacteria bacterium RU_5_0]NJR61147.1 Gfo/Idh/MocA family oxidoreductase [Cyanobacteria bacterium CRU_2_1]